MDLALKNGRIVKIGQLGQHAAGNEIDAAGSVVAPEFIDSHSHADLALPTGGIMALKNGRVTGRNAGRFL